MNRHAACDSRSTRRGCLSGVLAWAGNEYLVTVACSQLVRRASVAQPDRETPATACQATRRTSPVCTLADDHLRRIALSGTYPLVNDVAAEVLEVLDRLTTVEARLSGVEEGKLG